MWESCLKMFSVLRNTKKAPFGIGYNLAWTWNTDKFVLNKDNAINIDNSEINSIEWYVPHYRPTILSQAILTKQIWSITSTEVQYVERSVFVKEVNGQKFWTFEFGTQEEINVPIWIIVGIQQRDRQDSKNLNNDTFYRPPATSAQCIIGTKKISWFCYFIKLWWWWLFTGIWSN